MKKISEYTNAFFHIFGLHLSIHRTSRDLNGLPTFVDKKFVPIFDRHQDKTMITWSGCYSNYLAAKYVAKAGINGDIVECGVWRGGSSIMMAETLSAYGVTNKKIRMYDTFEGMTDPTDADFLISDPRQKAVDLLRNSKKSVFI